MGEDRQIGRYRLLERVGKGGMAEVFKAEDRPPDGPPRLVAVKRLFPKLAADREFVGMFVNEARIASGMQHPNIVRVHDLVNIGSSYYIVMEYLEGLDLESLVAASPPGQLALTLPEIGYVVHQVALGLDYAHQGGGRSDRGPVVHRDITPGNVLVDRQGRVKITDFGIARAMQYASFTRPGLLKGKYEYMAPEYVQGLPFDGRADLFSLGVVLYELLTGRSPFQGVNAKEIWARVLREEPAPPSSLVREATRPMDSVALKALAKRPEKRYQTGAEMAQALQRFFTLKPRRGTQLPPQVLGARVACGLTPACANLEEAKTEKLALAGDEGATDATQEIHLDELLGLVEPVSVPRLPVPEEARALLQAQTQAVTLAKVPAPARAWRWRGWRLWLGLGLAAGLLAAAALAVLLLWPPADGLLSVSSSRPAEVWLDGVPLGAAPIVARPVPPGPHRIELRRVGRKQARTFERQVAPGEPLVLEVTWPRPPRKQPAKKRTTGKRGGR
ncbi:MAG TPA: serine/threonine-protein kinase [Myxococcota bacterium]|nr:serine/threonine-protein kinase [Myxococcota bacterium]HRY92367.1 serine/threonine-protein kinase [Myxococcota bacterium]HSA22938.1 serine/threonine-protein kinase [Myxococcota bacterium]